MIESNPSYVSTHHGLRSDSDMITPSYVSTHHGVLSDMIAPSYVQNCIKDGKIVPVEITCKLLVNAMQEHMGTSHHTTDTSSVFLIDGFPRNMDNLNGWLKVWVVVLLLTV